MADARTAPARSCRGPVVMAAVLAASVQAAEPVQWRDHPAIDRIFTEAGAVGTFVSCRVAGGVHTGRDAERARERFVPASTFKIPNTLFALDTGAVSGPEEMFAWDGEPRRVGAWEDDMTFAEALRVSNVNVYQEVARRIGPERMRARVAAVGYGNGRIGERVDTFWLDGPLKISAIEQCGFLLQVADGDLPVGGPAFRSLRGMLAERIDDDTVLYAKTGWAESPGGDIGWWVGWVEGPFGRAAFALNLDMPDASWVPRRTRLGRAALRELGYLPTGP